MIGDGRVTRLSGDQPSALADRLSSTNGAPPPVRGKTRVILERVRWLLETKGARTRDAEGRLIPTEPVTRALSRSQSYLDIEREFLARWRRV